jgi:hypothetical protein
MTKKQEQELLATVEELKQQRVESDARAEDQARTITQQNQQLLQQRKQQDGEGIAWEADSSKNYDSFGSFTLNGVEYGICLTSTWKNSDRQIQSKAGKKGQRLFVFAFKTSKEQFEADTGHSGPLMPDNDAENGRYDDVVVNKGHSLDDGDLPTHERGV